MNAHLNAKEFRISEMPGDGIGIEVMEACKAVLAALGARVGGYTLALEFAPAGAMHYRATGTALPDASVRDRKSVV